MFNDTPNAIFMIEGGKALRLVKEHIDDRRKCDASVRQMCNELGVQNARRDRTNGRLTSVNFPGAVPAGWTVRDKHGCSRPKRGTDWAKRFATQIVMADPSAIISKEFSIPLCVGYTQPHGEGWLRIGNMLTECGFLYLSANGPYAMWCPDVPAAVAELEAEGDKVVKEPARSFKMHFDGCRRIHQEEWDMLVLQDSLAKKRALAA